MIVRSTGESICAPAAFRMRLARSPPPEERSAIQARSPGVIDVQVAVQDQGVGAQSAEKLLMCVGIDSLEEGPHLAAVGEEAVEALLEAGPDAIPLLGQEGLRATTECAVAVDPHGDAPVGVQQRCLLPGPIHPVEVSLELHPAALVDGVLDLRPGRVEPELEVGLIRRPGPEREAGLAEVRPELAGEGALPAAIPAGAVDLLAEEELRLAEERQVIPEVLDHPVGVDDGEDLDTVDLSHLGFLQDLIAGAEPMSRGEDLLVEELRALLGVL